MNFKALAMSTIEKDDVDEFKKLKKKYKINFSMVSFTEDPLYEVFLKESISKNSVKIANFLFDIEPNSIPVLSHTSWAQLFVEMAKNNRLEIAKKFLQMLPIKIFTKNKFYLEDNFWSEVSKINEVFLELANANNFPMLELICNNCSPSKIELMILPIFAHAINNNLTELTEWCVGLSIKSQITNNIDIFNNLIVNACHLKPNIVLSLIARQLNSKRLAELLPRVAKAVSSFAYSSEDHNCVIDILNYCLKNSKNETAILDDIFLTASTSNPHLLKWSFAKQTEKKNDLLYTTLKTIKNKEFTDSNLQALANLFYLQTDEIILEEMIKFFLKNYVNYLTKILALQSGRTLLKFIVTQSKTPIEIDQKISPEILSYCEFDTSKVIKLDQRKEIKEEQIKRYKAIKTDTLLLLQAGFKADIVYGIIQYLSLAEGLSRTVLQSIVTNLAKRNARIKINNIVFKHISGHDDTTLAFADYLSSGFKLTAKDNNGNTALLLAAFHGKINILKWLLQQGASLQDKNDCAYSLFLMATKGGQVETMQFLLSINPNFINDLDHKQNGAVHIAAEMGHVNALEFLTSQGLSLSDTNKFGGTPIICAASGGSIAAIIWLLERGATLEERSTNGTTPLLEAASKGQNEMITWLLDVGHVSVDQINQLGYNVLYLAAENNHFSLVKWLINKYGNELYKASNSGSELTPLGIAAANGHLKIVRFFLKHKIGSVDEKYLGDSLILIALLAGQKHVTEYLQKIGVILNSATCVSALRRAVITGNIELFTYLSSLDKNLQNICQPHPILVAAQHNQLAMLRYLLEQDISSITRCDANENNVAIYSIASSGLDVLQFLFQNYRGKFFQDKNLDAAYWAAINFEKWDAFIYLLNNVRPTSVNNLLFQVVAKGYLPGLIALVKEGASLNALNNENKNLIQVATEMGHFAIVKWLIENRLSYERDNAGNTPLILAVKASKVEVVKLLLTQGVDRDVTDNTGKNVWLIAKEINHPEIIQLLSQDIQPKQIISSQPEPNQSVKSPTIVSPSTRRQVLAKAAATRIAKNPTALTSQFHKVANKEINSVESSSAINFKKN